MKRSLIVIALLGIFLAACSPAPSAEIVGVWELVSYGDPVTPALPGVDTSIEFKSDGTLAGNVGCNGFGGEYKVNGGTVEFGPIMMTEMFCEVIAEQESAVVAVLSGNAAFSVNGDTLTITSANGSTLVVLARK